MKMTEIEYHFQQQYDPPSYFEYCNDRGRSKQREVLPAVFSAVPHIEVHGGIIVEEIMGEE